MAVEKVKFMNIMGPLSKLDEVIALCAETGQFHVENASSLIGSQKNFLPIIDRNPYLAPLSAAEDLIKKLGLAGGAKSDFTCEFILEEAARYLSGLAARVLEISEKTAAAREKHLSDDQILKQVSPIIGLKIPLAQLFSLEYVKFRFGRMTKESFHKLDAGTTGAEPYIFVATSAEEEYVYGMYFAARDAVGRADAAMSALHFEHIFISERADGIPADVFSIISKEEHGIEDEIAALEGELAALAEEHGGRVLFYYRLLCEKSSLFEVRQSCVKTRNSFIMVGWLPEKLEQSFRGSLKAFGDVNCIADPPDDKTLPEPPTKLKNFALFKPFSMFVTMYGLPKYGEIDPTPLVAITYSLMFGLMFGDVGQGLALFVIGLIFALVKKSDFGRIIATVGVFSTLGGFVYGSVFGYEDIIPGLIHPLGSDSDFYVTMGVSIAIGVVLIVTVMIMNIVNCMRRKDFTSSVFGHNGIAGLVFYVAVILAVLGLMGFGTNLLTAPYIILFVVIPLVAIFLKEPLGKLVAKRRDVMPHSVGEYILENFFELFETLLSYITNTVSFVRIGAFALNHAGMMMFVFILSRMSGSSENLAVVIIGNIVVIGLEGLIVGIQGLRLQFYELFSRFFSGEGREYSPLKTNNKLMEEK